MFGRGDLKYALLGLLQEHPKHGYEMIKDLENRSGGFYSPSAGAIYPTLQLLEDRGWVSVEVVEGKKVYTITDEGRQAFTEYNERSSGFPFGGPGGEPGFGPGFGPRGPHGHRGHPGHEEHGGRGGWSEQRRGPWGPFGWETGPELRALAHESRDVARLMREAVMSSGRDPERLKQLRGIVERVRGELLTFISQHPGDQPARQGDSQPGERSQQTSGEGPVEQL
jgi:hypothetical protein